MIWNQPVTVDAINAMNAGTLAGQLGIEVTEVGNDYLRATMPVDARTMQPMGLLHGGASVVLAETLGSIGAYGCVDPDRYLCVGLDINANHIRSVRSGHVTGTARPLHLGGRTQVWEIRIEDDTHRLVCISRLTMAVLEK